MKTNEKNEKKGIRRLSDEELKEVTGGRVAGIDHTTTNGAGAANGLYQCPDGTWARSEKDCPIRYLGRRVGQ